VIRAYQLDIPQTLEEACTPSRTALVVYDMQVGILSQLQNGAAVTTKVAEVLGAAREAGVRVIFLRHMSLPKELMGVSQLRQAMAWQRVGSVDEVRPWFLRDSPGFQLAPELAPLPSEAILDKITFSAFEGTPLDIALRDCGITSFILVGVATDWRACASWATHSSRQRRSLRISCAGKAATHRAGDRATCDARVYPHRLSYSRVLPGMVRRLSLPSCYRR
jgi:nicotinamidase-related amidase